MDHPGYLQHFRLHGAPFGTAPDAALFYAQGARRELLGALAYAVTHGDGIVKITGDAGSGMTMLCHALARQLTGQAVVIHMEPDSVGPLGVIHATALALGLDPDGQRSDEVLRGLQNHLTAMRAGGRHAVLMADHADALPSDALEEIRLLTNLDDGNGKLLQIVLLGQHALNASLRQHAMRQFRERITLSFVMPHLEPDEVPALLAHRLRAVGYEGLDMFAPDAAHLLASHAKGDLRRVIHLAHQALEATASEGAVSVTERHVQAAIRGRLPAHKPRGMVRPAVAGAIVVAAALGIVAAMVLRQAPRRATAAALPMYTGVIKSAAPMALTAGSQGGGAASAAAAAAGAATSAPATPAAAAAPAPAAPVIAKPEPAAATATATLLQQTLKAGKTWLRDEPDSHFSIKIEDFPASDPARAEAFLTKVRDAIGLGDVHAYPTLNKGEHRIGIAYGSFGSEQQARTAMAALNGRWRYAPKIRNIGAIRAAVSRAGHTQPRARQ